MVLSSSGTSSPRNSEPADGISPAPGNGALSGRDFLLVTLVFLAVSLPFLGGPPLFDPDEGYYPETAREMIERGDLLDPVFNGEPRWGKPVLFYLADAVSLKLLGLNEFAARLPSLLAGLGLALLCACAGGVLYGRRAGLYAGLACATSLQTIVYSRAAVPDMLLAVFVALALYGYIMAFAGTAGQSGADRERWLLLMYGGAGLAFLSKGPLGVILPGMAVFFHLLLSGRIAEVRRLRLFSGLGVFLAAVLPWYAYMYSLHGTPFLEEHFIQRNVNRYFTDRWEHAGPLYYYLPVLLAGAFPWTVAAASGAFGALRGALSVRRGSGKPAPADADLLVLCWLVPMLVFFSLSRSKLPNYVLPVYPAVALLAARCITGLEAGGSRRRTALVVWPTGLFALAVAAAGAPLLSRKIHEGLDVVLLWLSPVLLVTAASVLWQARGNLSRWFGVSTAGMTLFMTMITGVAIPRVERLQAVRELASAHRGSLSSERRVAMWRVWSPSFLFYARTGALRFNPETGDWQAAREQGIDWVLTRSSSLDEFAGRTGSTILESFSHGGRVLLRLAPEPRNGP